MNNNPIGIFDSGLGGLSCISSITRAMPGETILYFGDTARTPYGDKAPETIRRFTYQITDFLVSRGAKVLVIACNTISALCTDMLIQRYPGVPIIDIIRPTVAAIAADSRNKSPIGIIATKATVGSGMYEKLLRQSGVKAPIHSVACPLFVPMIESGFREGEVVEAVVRHYLEALVKDRGIRRLVLGCTHYPFIESSIRKLYPELEIINPSRIISDRVQQVLQQEGLAAPESNDGEDLFYASDLSDTFLNMIPDVSPDDNYSIKFQAFHQFNGL